MSVAVGVVAAALGVVHTPLLKVRHVRVAGAGAAVPAGVVLHAAGLDHQALMVDVSTSSDTRRLESLPLVAIATVTRQWPGTVRINLTTRDGVAVTGVGLGRAVVDRTGRVLAVGPAVGAGLPAINAQVGTVAAGQWLPGSPGPGPAALAATAPGAPAPAVVDPSHPLAGELSLAAALGPAVRSDVQAISVTAADGLVATVGTTAVVFGDASQLAAKIRGLAAVVAHGPLVGVTRIDLRVPDRPALSGPAPSAAATGGSGG
ncbi:FtsQ-type POTRA domain-containing protein [Acidiferrimicrobium sp. IK]|uniref:cell division protein FtsQ/DivIB n=1 Tax=Acidiferrimicrobium sp. IK TaxID=2871700 RepID=UPI0021CAF93F|nr:FtsQ-type POTRA domain-containing protein [Acidiferrimicrobium sp. IK]MCU4183683.1 FtsQ-type POTRA domain-containing protein [Acidiferrimicrobium sp. IK]